MRVAVIPFVVSLAWMAKTASASCTESVDCPSSSYHDVTRFKRYFHLEYKKPLKDDSVCKDWQDQAHVFVDAYNALSRFHCDTPCFRRATGAKMVTKCGPSRPDFQLSTNALQQELTAIVEVYFDQEKTCPTMDHALDTAKNDTFAMSNEHYFQDVCGFEPVAWTKEISYDKHKPKPDKCCCPCDSTQPLAEDDMKEIFNRYLYKKGLPCDWVSVNELETPDDFCHDWIDYFPRVVLTEWTGKGDSLSGLIGKVNDIICDTYNGISFDRCDGRQLAEWDTKQVSFKKDKSKKHRDLQDSPAGYVTEYPQTKCPHACTESTVKARAICRDPGCPSPTDISLFSEKVVPEVTRKLEQATQGAFAALMEQNRQLYDYHLDYVIDVIYDKCLCRTHFDQPGSLPSKADLIKIINDEFMGKTEFLHSQVGAIKDFTEYVAVPTLGHPYDTYIPPVTVYVSEGLCKEEEDKKGHKYWTVDESKVHDLVEVIRRAYNDMVIEDCDKPWFRQLISAKLNGFFESKFDCKERDDFVMHVSFDFRCHGHCSIFESYPKNHRELGHEERRPLAATRNMVETAPKQSPATPDEELKMASDEKHRELGDYYHPPEGLCALENVNTPKSPTLVGWVRRANDHKPSGHGELDILWDYHGELCRCESDYEAHHYGYTDWYVINGIHVAPKHKCPTAPDYYWFDLFYC